MALRTAKIFVLNRANKQNKELLDFINKNINDIILKGCIKFDFRKIDIDDVDNYSQRGIREFPSMQIDGRIISKPNIIIQELIAHMRANKIVAPPKTDEEVVNDYLREEVTAGVAKDSKGKYIQPKEEEDEQSKINSEIRSKMIEEEKRRGLLRAGASEDRPARRDNDMQEQRQPARPVYREDNVDPGSALDVLNHTRPRDN